MVKRKFIVYILTIMLVTLFVTGCGNSNNGGIQFEKPDDIDVNEYDSKEWKEAYRNLVVGWTKGEIDPYCDTESLRFDLVYINADEMPEFVVSGDGWIYMYTYCPGSVASGVSNVNILMEEWWWGMNANTGYYYIPYENAIRNDHSDEERYTVDYFHMNENFALVDWYSIWYDIVENENGTANTYFYEGPETLEESVSAEESAESSQEQTTESVSAEDTEANIEHTSKIITKEVTEEEWLTYNFPDKIIEFLGGTLTKDEMLDKIDACVVTKEGAPAFVGLQPIHYVPENDSVHRQNYYDMITLLEEKLPKHNIASEDTEGDVEIISLADGDIGSDGKKDVAAILKSYDPSVSGWDDYGRYSFTVCVFTKIDGAYKCTAINHNMLANNEQYYEEDDHEYLVEISAEGELQVSYTVKNGDNRECSKYCYALEGNALILSRLEKDYSNQSSGCGKIVVQSILTGEVMSGAYSNLEDSFEAWELYTGTCETAMLTFDKMTLWQIPQVDESLMNWNENAKDYNYKALWLEEYLKVEQNENGEVVETLEPWQKAYLNLLQAIALDKTDIYNNELTYKLIYINEDEIPELVVSQNGYFVSVFTYAPEGEYADVKEVNVLLENCGYGAMGNIGYYYLPKDNIIYNYNSDFAGAAGTTWYGYINESNQLDSKYTIYFEDIDMQDDSEECKYYFNGKEISKDLYETYKVDGNFKFIEGNKKAYEIVEDIVDL